MSHRLRRGNWSVQELERLRLLFPHRGVEQTAALLRRSADSVQRKALDLLRVPPRKGAWTDSDDWQLRQAWGAVELRLLAPMLGRPANEVRSRAAELRSRLRSGAWTREERRLLKKLYGTRADEDLEVSLMRSQSEIATAAQSMCLAKDKRFQAACNNAAKNQSPTSNAKSGAKSRVKAGGKHGKAAPPIRSRMPRWTLAEVEKLQALYPDHDNLAVARALGRSVTSVANKAFQLGIHKSAELLTNIGRSNIAHRYRAEGVTAAEGTVAVPQPSAEPAVELPPVANPPVALPAVTQPAVTQPAVELPAAEPTVILPTAAGPQSVPVCSDGDEPSPDGELVDPVDLGLAAEDRGDPVAPRGDRITDADGV